MPFWSGKVCLIEANELKLYFLDIGRQSVQVGNTISTETNVICWQQFHHFLLGIEVNRVSLVGSWFNSLFP